MMIFCEVIKMRYISSSFFVNLRALSITCTLIQTKNYAHYIEFLYIFRIINSSYHVASSSFRVKSTWSLACIITLRTRLINHMREMILFAYVYELWTLPTPFMHTRLRCIMLHNSCNTRIKTYLRHVPSLTS